MTDAADKSSEEKDQEIESPAGKTPDWMKLATSAANSGPSLTEESTPAWLKSIRAGKGITKESQSTKPEPAPAPPSPAPSSTDSMSDLERLLAEEGIDLSSVPEERPEGSENMSARDWLIATSSEELIRSKLGAEPMPELTSTGPGESPMSDLERLLAEEGIDLGSVPEERPSEAGGMSARDWLISTSSDELIRNKLGAEPLPTPTLPPSPAPLASPPPPVDDKMVVEEDLPDWLQEIAEESAAPGADLFAGSEPAEDDQLVVRDELPDWLQDIAEESTEPEPVPMSLPGLLETPLTSSSVDDGTVVESELPDWLRDIGDEAPTVISQALPPVSSQPAAEGGLIVEEELPDWLRQVEEEPAPSEPAQTGLDDLASAAPIFNEDKMVVQEDLPDWLREVEAETPAGETAATAGLTDWLPEASVEPAGGQADLAVPLLEADKMVVEEDLPDWLREVEAKEVEGGLLLDTVRDELISGGGEPGLPEADLPDWLREVETTEIAAEELPSYETAAQGLPEPAAPVDLEHLDVEEEDLPDWLREVQAEADATPPARTAAEPLPPSLDAGKVGADMIIEEELPDWLREAQEELTSLPPEEKPPMAAFELETERPAEEELPDWLQEVDTDFDELFEPSEPSPEVFADALPEDDLIIADELPDWLREVEEEPPAPALQPEIPVTEGELPDWLRGVEAELPTLAGETLEPIAPAGPFDEVINQAELPDWLRGVETELPAAPAETPEPVEQAELPDWLRQVETETVSGEELIAVAEPEPAIMIPSQPVEAEAVTVEAPAPLVAETPAPAVTEAAAVEVPATPVIETPVAAALAGIPDWLQKLREVEPEPAPTPVLIQPVAAPTPVMAAQAAPRPAVAPPNPEWPADADEQLKLARTARDKGEWDQAIAIYDSLVAKGVYLNKIIEDMQQAIKTQATNYLLYQLMGDAMMRDGRLQSALNAYREALTRL